MTGIYGTSQEDRIRERELDKHTEKDDYTYDDAEDLEKHNYNFPEYLNNNKNFVQLIKFMTEQDISQFVYYIAIIADEKNDIDARHWASYELNVFLTDSANNEITTKN